MNRNIIAVAVVTFLASASARAGEKHPPAPTNPEFKQLSGLVGTWQGTSKDHDKDGPFEVSYEVTSGGSALVEKLFVGQPHEMVSVYHPVGKKVQMTHYCMLGNQPTLQLTKATPTSLEFDFIGGAGIDPKKDHHMHSLTVTWLDQNHVVEKWQSREGGKEGEATVLELTRKNAG